MEYTKNHYNSHSNKFSDHRAAKRHRQGGPAYELKRFHNKIKRLLIRRFGFRCQRLLDMCCGRGGDINKWVEAEVRYVRGIDLSPGEIQEAAKRYRELPSSKRQRTICEFEDSDGLGLRPLEVAEPYDVATCMFALHYFCVKPDALKMFMSNVSRALKIGGHFIATFPDGKEILKCLRDGDTLDMPLFKLNKMWRGRPQCFGSAFTFAITDTVTHGEDQTAGSFEYLVFFTVLTQIASEYHLRPVLHYEDEELNRCFAEADLNQPFKHFNPHFDGTPGEYRPSLETASRCNIAVVFRRVDKNAPPPRRSPPKQPPKVIEPTYAWDSEDETFP